jgi:hypothetical protein
VRVSAMYAEDEVEVYVARPKLLRRFIAVAGVLVLRLGHGV